MAMFVCWISPPCESGRTSHAVRLGPMYLPTEPCPQPVWEIMLTSYLISISLFFRIQQVGKEAYTLGLSSFSNPSVGAACVCFLELLGLSSLKLRVDLKMANVILGSKHRHEDARSSAIRESLGTAPLHSAMCCPQKFGAGQKYWGGNESFLFLYSSHY